MTCLVVLSMEGLEEEPQIRAFPAVPTSCSAEASPASGRCSQQDVLVLLHVQSTQVPCEEQELCRPPPGAEGEEGRLQG